MFFEWKNPYFFNKNAYYLLQRTIKILGICVVVGCQMFVKVVLSCIFWLFYFCVQNKLEPLSGISLLLIFAVVVLNVFFWMSPPQFTQSLSLSITGSFSSTFSLVLPFATRSGVVLPFGNQNRHIFLIDPSSLVSEHKLMAWNGIALVQVTCSTLHFVSWLFSDEWTVVILAKSLMLARDLWAQVVDPVFFQNGATAIREKEAAAFAKESGDLKTNITAVGKAVAALEKGVKGQSGGFLQTEAASILKNLVVTDQKLVDVDREDLTAFLSGA